MNITKALSGIALTSLMLSTTANADWFFLGTANNWQAMNLMPVQALGTTLSAAKTE